MTMSSILIEAPVYKPKPIKQKLVEPEFTDCKTIQQTYKAWDNSQYTLYTEFVKDPICWGDDGRKLNGPVKYKTLNKVLTITTIFNKEIDIPVEVKTRLHRTAHKKTGEVSYVLRGFITTRLPWWLKRIENKALRKITQHTPCAKDPFERIYIKYVDHLSDL